MDKILKNADMNRLTDSVMIETNDSEGLRKDTEKIMNIASKTIQKANDISYVENVSDLPSVLLDSVDVEKDKKRLRSDESKKRENCEVKAAANYKEPYNTVPRVV